MLILRVLRAADTPYTIKGDGMFWAAAISLLIAKAALPPCALPSVQRSTAGPVAIAGDVAKPFSLTADDAGSYVKAHSTVRQSSEGKTIEGDFEGVSIADLLRRAGARGKVTKAGLVDSIIVARAPLDDPSASSVPYEVTLSYSEVSPLLSRHPAFVAFQCNGEPISPTLVVPDDLTDARYVHELSSLTFNASR